MMRRLALFCLALLVFTACGKNNSFQSADAPEFQVDGPGFIRLQLPRNLEQSASQENVRLRNAGEATLQFQSFEWIDQPDSLYALRKVEENSSLGACESDGDCNDGEVCVTSTQTCNPTGLPDPFELEAKRTIDLDFLITAGTAEMSCPEAGEDVPVEFQNEYCGAIRVQTNADNDGENVEDGVATIYFLDPGASGQAMVEPSSLEYCEVLPGSTQSQTFSITNSGMNELEVLTAGVEDNPTFFNIAPTTGSLPTDVASGTALQFEVTVEIPEDQQDYDTSTFLNIETSAGVQKVFIEVTSGPCAGPEIGLDTNVLRFDGGASQTLTVSNTGSATLQITGLSVNPPEARDFYRFEIDGTDVTDNFGGSKNVPKGDMQEIVVNFSRPDGNEESSVGVLEIAHNDRRAGFKSEVTLLGDEGDVPIGEIEPQGFTFLAEDGNSATRAFVIRNIGTAALDITNITWGTFSQGSNAEFQVTGATGMIAPGAIQRAEMTFTGMNASPDVGVVNFDSNNPADLSMTLRALPSATVVPQPVIEVGGGTLQVGSPVTLDGTSSTPDGIATNAVWTLLSRPAGSSSWLSDVGEETSFVPDTAGDYEIALTILNGDREAQTTTTVTVE